MVDQFDLAKAACSEEKSLVPLLGPARPAFVILEGVSRLAGLSRYSVGRMLELISDQESRDWTWQEGMTVWELELGERLAKAARERYLEMMAAEHQKEERAQLKARAERIRAEMASLSTLESTLNAALDNAKAERDKKLVDLNTELDAVEREMVRMAQGEETVVLEEPVITDVALIPEEAMVNPQAKVADTSTTLGDEPDVAEDTSGQTQE